jgi:HK97 gp10 family phage protein
MAFGINLTGVKEIELALKKIDTKLKQDLSDEMNSSALTIASNAKKLAPVDLGFLRNSIGIEPSVNGLTYEVEAKAKYAAYIEFGTGGLVDVPVGYEDLAIRFKGKNIMKVNIRPQPYLVPSFETEKPKLIKRLKDMLNA